MLFSSVCLKSSKSIENSIARVSLEAAALNTATTFTNTSNIAYYASSLDAVLGAPVEMPLLTLADLAFHDLKWFAHSIVLQDWHAYVPFYTRSIVL
jgi:hypothetical protein